MRAYFVAALGLVLAACAPVEQAPTPSASQPQAECAARGGAMQRVGRAQTLQCVIPFADANKPCRDGGECQSGRCLGPVDASGQANVTGQCQPSNMTFGCYTSVINGRAAAAICVD